MKQAHEMKIFLIILVKLSLFGRFHGEWKKRLFFFPFCRSFALPIGNKCNVIVFELCLAELFRTITSGMAWLRMKNTLNNSECLKIKSYYQQRNSRHIPNSLAPRLSLSSTVKWHYAQSDKMFQHNVTVKRVNNRVTHTYTTGCSDMVCRCKSQEAA